jgi:hypothetical protein
MVLDFLTAKAKKEFAVIIESVSKSGPVNPEQCNTTQCEHVATRVKDLADYAEKNFPKSELTKQYLQTAYCSCANCPRIPKNNNCEDVFRRVNLAKHYLNS